MSNESGDRFNYIVQAAKHAPWIYQYPKFASYQIVGDLIAWEERIVPGTLNFEPKPKGIRLVATVADNYHQENDTCEKLLWRPNGLYRLAKVDPCAEDHVINIESNGICPGHQDDIEELVHAIIGDLSRMIHDHSLRSAIETLGARLVGVRCDAWQR